MQSLSSRLGTALGLLVMAAVAAAGCHSTLPSIFLAMEDPSGLHPTQLRVHVRVDGQDAVTVTRPEAPGAPLTGTQTMRLLMPETAIEQDAQLTVEALLDGQIVGTAETVVHLGAAAETTASVSLAPGTGCPGPGCVCDASSCPFGCCDGNTCVQGETAACGTGGAACEACPADAADTCLEGACRCGPDAPCPSGYACDTGRCLPSTGQACSTGDRCATPPSQCHVEEGICGEDGRCAYALKPADTVCDDGNSCTTGDACDPTGLCVGAPLECADGGGCNLSEGQCVQGTCLYEPVEAGTACTDADPCTDGQTCDGAGNCGGGTTRSCQTPPPGECFEPAGTCTPDGGCTYQPKAEGASCGVDTACVSYACNGSGVCLGLTKAPGTACGEITSCSAQTCNASGVCETNTQPNGTSCGFAGECGNQRCQEGTCTTFLEPNGAPCGVSDSCKDSSCFQGSCQILPKNDGLPCSTTLNGLPPMGCGACNAGYCMESCGPDEICCGSFCQPLSGPTCSLEPSPL